MKAAGELWKLMDQLVTHCGALQLGLLPLSWRSGHAWEDRKDNVRRWAARAGTPILNPLAWK